MLNWEVMENRAVAFSTRWRNCNGREKQEGQTFEKDLMSVFGVDWREANHEYTVVNDEGRNNYVDYFIPNVVAFEMKSRGESLVKAYNQCMDYVKCLKSDEKPELVVVSDFDFIEVTNIRINKTFKKFKVSQLKKYIGQLSLIAGYKSEVEYQSDIELNRNASYLLADLHDALKDNGYSGHDLENMLIRILFCLFAEDASIFEKHSFSYYIKESKEDGSDLGEKIITLFKILDTADEKRMVTMPENFKKFRYINGKLFTDRIETPFFDKKMRDMLLKSCEYNWSEISPAIFGSLFQGIMDKITRRNLGAHYTSEENILKALRPLFLDDLWIEFERSKSTKVELEKFHNKLLNIKIADFACGTGNFLIIAYREIRRIEFEVLKLLHGSNQMVMIEKFDIVSLENFYGVEIDDSACEIAKLSLLLAKHLIDMELSEYFLSSFIDFPIKEYANIIQKNALLIDWDKVVPATELSYIVGNPPFVGGMMMNEEQKSEMRIIFDNMPGSGELDYVCAWYKKACEYIKINNIRCALVSTNSICQGQQAFVLWEYLFKNYNIHIDFAYTTFIWNNEAKDKAKVHCIIVGFSKSYNGQKYLFKSDDAIKANNINSYLVDAPSIFIQSVSKPLYNVSAMRFGSMPRDDGGFILTEDEKEELIEKEPLAEKWIRLYLGSVEFLHNKKRYCLWLKGANPSEVAKCPMVVKRIEHVRKARSESKAAGTRKFADTPMLFCQIAQPDTDYIVVPEVSSERRRYIPIGFMSKDVIASNLVFLIPDATLYEFGILTSNVHNAWMRTVAGRLKSDYRYAKDIVYNTFPWPEKTVEHKERIEKAAQMVLDARALYQDSCLADLYDPNLMPPELVKAHRLLDKEACKTYGTIWKSEEECIADLMKLYQAKIAELENMK